MSDTPTLATLDRAPLRARAAGLDAADPLAAVRDRFTVDLAPGEIYLDGNSLGLLPRGVAERLDAVVRHEWGTLRIRSWSTREDGGSDWWRAPERVGDRIAPLVGAGPGQVVVSDSTSVNVFKALVAAVRMADQDAGGDRDEILVDAATFPTDGYVAQAAARLTGRTLRPVDPGELPAALGPRTAAVLVNHVDYRTGRLRDLPGLTAQVHAAGAYAVWDLCHSAGALPVGLDEHGVDLAVGCTYKFLNGGPGAPAFLYVRRALQPRFDSPLPGWNSHAEPFGMRSAYAPADGAVRGRVGTPDILSLLALDAALDAWEGVTVAQAREKSLALTDFFVDCVRRYAGRYVPAGRVRIVTPLRHEERGSQVAVRVPGADGVMRRLVARGVVGDHRPPDILRFGFAPLYLTFAETESAAAALAEELAGELT
jgi:kynureninase